MHLWDISDLQSFPFLLVLPEVHLVQHRPTYNAVDRTKTTTPIAYEHRNHNLYTIGPFVQVIPFDQ